MCNWKLVISFWFYSVTRRVQLPHRQVLRARPWWGTRLYLNLLDRNQSCSCVILRADHARQGGRLYASRSIDSSAALGSQLITRLGRRLACRDYKRAQWI